MAYLKVILEGEFVSYSPEDKKLQPGYVLAQVLVSESVKLNGSIQFTHQHFTVLVPRQIANSISISTNDLIYIEGQLLNNSACDLMCVPAGTLLVRTLHKQSAFFSKSINS